MTEIPAMKTKALAPWFGANRMLAKNVGVELRGAEWVGIPFCGGCSELAYIQCRGGVANDLHRHLINLARVVRDPEKRTELQRRLDATLFHPDELMRAQLRCLERQKGWDSGSLFGSDVITLPPDGDLGWAYDYFVVAWMSRSALAGTPGEFTGGLPTRWNANGGGSNVRFRSASDSLDAWGEVCRRWEFETLDAFEFLDRVRDEEGLAIYVDAPWPDAGDGYSHSFTPAHQRRLAKKLWGYKHTRIVIRYGDHPLIRELYPTTKWNWVFGTSRDQDNKDVREVLILNVPSRAGGPT